MPTFTSDSAKHLWSIIDSAVPSIELELMLALVNAQLCSTSRDAYQHNILQAEPLLNRRNEDSRFQIPAVTANRQITPWLRVLEIRVATPAGSHSMMLLIYRQLLML